MLSVCRLSLKRECSVSSEYAAVLTGYRKLRRRGKGSSLETASRRGNHLGITEVCELEPYVQEFLYFWSGYPGRPAFQPGGTLLVYCCNGSPEEPPIVATLTLWERTRV